MPKRSLIISEEFGVYRVQRNADVFGTSGKSVEDAVIRAAKINGLGDPEIHNNAEMGELLELLLGKKSEESGISHTLNQ